MASLYEIRQKAQQAEGRQGDQISMIPDAYSPAPSSTAAPQRDYSAIYAAIRTYHDRHNPPRLTLEYWQEAVKGMGETAASLGNDPFALALLEAVYSEMEREYTHLKTGDRAS